jgi:ribosomal protein L35
MEPNPVIMDLPRILCLAVAIGGALIALASYWRRQRTSLVNGAQRRISVPASGKIVYHDAPTVHAVDSQRVDRMRKVMRLAPLEFVDVLESRGSPIPRFRVTVKSIDADHEVPSVRVLVEFGGTPVSCGALVKEVAPNQFVLPRVMHDEPRSSVFHFHERGDTLDFMRIKFNGVENGAAEIEILQVSGHWPTGAV